MKNTNESSENTNGKSGSATAKTLVAIAAGAAAGAVTALLLAPQSGTETRKAISTKANKLKEDLSQTVKQRIDDLKKKEPDLSETKA